MLRHRNDCPQRRVSSRSSLQETSRSFQIRSAVLTFRNMSGTKGVYAQVRVLVKTFFFSPHQNGALFLRCWCPQKSSCTWPTRVTKQTILQAHPITRTMFCRQSISACSPTLTSLQAIFLFWGESSENMNLYLRYKKDALSVFCRLNRSRNN